MVGLAVCIIGPGCTGVVGVACTDQLNSTIVVQARDAITGAPAAIGATVIVRGGAVYDSAASPARTPSSQDSFAVTTGRGTRARVA